MPVSEAIISLGVAGVVYFGGSQVMSGRMTPSEFFSFITAMVMVFNPIKKLQGSYNVVQRSAGAAERVFHLLDERRAIVDRPGAVDMGRSSGRVEFRNVSFNYGGEPVLRNISLVAESSRMVALVGPSGGGKTTLVSLVPRFYDVSEGAIFIDGRDIRDVTVASPGFPDCPGGPGDHPVQRKHRQQHPLRESGRHPGRGGGGGQGGLCP